MLFKVASFVRIGSGGKGPPRREVIFSIAAASESESKAESQAADACFSNAISSGFGSGCRTGEGRLVSHDTLANEQICARDMSQALAEAFDLGRRLKTVILRRHFFRHLQEVVTDDGPGELRLRDQTVWRLRQQRTAVEEREKKKPVHGMHPINTRVARNRDKPRVPGHSAISNLGQIVAIQVHHLGPGRHEVFHELLLSRHMHRLPRSREAGV